MKLEWVDTIVERTVRQHPGCTSRTICFLVSRFFKAPGVWPNRNNIKFWTKRSKLIKQCLASDKYVNKGCANKHAWHLKED